jgi:hypothetical protein
LPLWLVLPALLHADVPVAMSASASPAATPVMLPDKPVG